MALAPPCPFLAGVQRRFERGELAAQRRDLLIEHLDLGQRPRGEPLLRVELPPELGGLALRVGRATANALVKALVAVALALAGRQARAQRVELFLEAERAGLLQREQLRELCDLRIEAVERGVFSAHPGSGRTAPPRSTVTRKMKPRMSVDSDRRIRY